MKNKNFILAAALALSATVTVYGQKATFTYFDYQGRDARFDKQYDAAREYLNPIMAGFYPDPSICRVGDVYYMVNSSFSFFPAVPVFESRDLVTWQQIGHVLDRPSQVPLDGQGVSGGIFAPDIKYNESNKTFYMITTNVGKGNFYVKTTDPRQGWSEPIYLPEIDGIDPSFYFGRNGEAYIVHNAPVEGEADYEGQRAIRILRFDVKGDSIIGTHKEIVRGGTHVTEKPIWIEGPHLYRIGKYYYLMCAEGGTGSFHSEVIFRSKNPMGPWEECPSNPILTQREGLDDNRIDPVSSTGHADLVQTVQGDWWAVFLGCRPYEADLYNTGRDTYLLPVTWKDGWPVILEKGKAVPVVNAKAEWQTRIGNGNNVQKPTTGNFSYHDSFDAGSLDMRWIFLRNPSDFYTLGSAGLTITPKAVDITRKESPSAVFVRQQHTAFSAGTQLKFVPRNDGNIAGMTLLQNEEYNFVFGKTRINGRAAVVLIRSEKTPQIIARVYLTDEEACKPLRLWIDGNGRFYDFSFAIGDENRQTLLRGADAANLSTGMSGGFIGACIGLYAAE